MEKRIFGVVLTLLGIAGLVYAAMEFSGGKENRSVLVYAILGVLFFFSGIGLIRSTKDKPS